MGLQANRDRGADIVGSGWGQFVVLRHECAQGHWDLMIEIAGEEKLWTWQVHVAPGNWPVELKCQRIADHRKDYLTYEGEISGGRGRVTRVDAGRARVLAREPGMEEGVRVELAGAIVRGTFTLLE